MGTFQLGKLFQESFPHFGTPLHVFCLLAHLFYFLFLAATTQFILDRFNLLLQEILTLLLVNILTGTHLDRCLYFGQLHFTIQDFKQPIGTFTQRINAQQFDFLVLLQRKVRTDKVHQEHVVRQVFDGKR